MSKPSKREDKFSWKEEDVGKAELSQCVKCKNNINFITCNVFNVKPNKYTTNKTKCPKIKVK